MSNFDPNAFLNLTITEANSTQSVPVPVGEYTAVIEKVEPRTWQSRDDASKSGVALDVFYSIDDSNVKALLGRDKITVKQGIMLDLTDGGGLDMGKGRNISLGRLRDATGLNVPGQPFSFAQLPGRAVRVRVKHRDGKNPGEIYSEVEGVAKLA